MKKLLLLLLATLSLQNVWAQSQQHDLAFNLSGAMLPIFKDYRLGAETSLRYYINNQASVGAKAQYTFNNYSHGFGFDTPRTLIHYLNISAVLQYDIINEPDFQLGVGVSPGFSLATLRDKTQIRSKEYYDEETGLTTVISRPLRINRDAYFTLTPNIDFSYKIANFDAEQTAALFLTGNIGYQISAGSGDFTKGNDFRNYTVSLGFTIKGTTL